MRFVLVLLLGLAVGAPASAAVHGVVFAPADDVSLPFLCNWGYDWQERCYRDNLDRLEFGGAGDKVWRSALRFQLDALPPGAEVLAAELTLSYDRTCVAPARRTAPCTGRGFTIEARPIYTASWYTRREVAFGPPAASAEIEPDARPERLVWDLTDTVAAWASGELPNYGVLLKLADEQEDPGVGGPALPSSSYPEAALRPWLELLYMD